jgi:hypothetical protein
MSSPVALPTLPPLLVVAVSAGARVEGRHVGFPDGAFPILRRRAPARAGASSLSSGRPDALYKFGVAAPKRVSLPKCICCANAA